MGPRAVALMDSATAMGFDWRPIPKFVDQSVLRERGIGGYGAARWNARRFVADSVQSGARLVTGTRAERVVTQGGTARRGRAGPRAIPHGGARRPGGARGGRPRLAGDPASQRYRRGGPGVLLRPGGIHHRHAFDGLDAGSSHRWWRLPTSTPRATC